MEISGLGGSMPAMRLANVVRVKPSLREVMPAERDVLERLLGEYLFEFDGTTEPYPYLDLYWEEPERRPFLIEADRRSVGLCLIRERGDGWSIAEFWVQPNLRRFGVGRTAIEAVAERGRAAGAEYLEAQGSSAQPRGAAVLDCRRVPRGRGPRDKCHRHSSFPLGLPARASLTLEPQNSHRDSELA
jgi:GNAT superfamily N-acetyltransferase